MKKALSLNKLATFLFYSNIIFFIISFNFAHNPPSGWYQQFMPDMNGQPISDMTFLDSLTGFAVTNDNNSSHDTGYILKTTNGGDSWAIKFKNIRDFSKIEFINSNIGFTCGGSGSGTSFLYKTTDAGENWFSINTGLGNLFFNDMSVLNEDTIWVVDKNDFNGGVYRTTNGGTNWILQYQPSGGQNPNKIYMLNGRIGFISNSSALSNTKKTTNGGFNWNIIDVVGFFDIYFADSLIGWKTIGDSIMNYTSNGGLNWTKRYMPRGGYIQGNSLTTFTNIGVDTIWGGGGYVRYPNGSYKGILFKSTNKGHTWLYQIPDTSLGIAVYPFINFTNQKFGWAHVNNVLLPHTGIHTVSGGDTTFYTGIIQTSTELPRDFELQQNYPNPFNPRTVIPYKIKSASYVRLTVYDILGKETQLLVNEHQNEGEYEVDFMGKYGSSGVYFYRIEIEDSKTRRIFAETKRMLLLK